MHTNRNTTGSTSREGRIERVSYYTGSTARVGTSTAEIRLREGVSRAHRVGVAIGLVVLALVCGGLMLAVYWAFVRTYSGQVVDVSAWRGAFLGRPMVSMLLSWLKDIFPILFGIIIVGAIITVLVVTLRRRRIELLLAAAVLVGGSLGTTELLKHVVLPRPDFGIDGMTFNSLPSGHTTAAASIAVAVVLVVPPVLRVAAALVGGLFAVLIGIGTLAVGWHRPSDVIAGYIVVAGWTALVTAFSQLRQPVVRDRGKAVRCRNGIPTNVLAWMLLVAAFVAGGIAVIMLGETHLRADPLNSQDSLLMAYGGGVAGSASAAAATFALALALAPVAGRSPTLED
ncbi:phosphatase PAP2 family protein [Spelaeicoccus albus]|uniref:Membrane-associated phospholipid phosphatase n=1 Tax=Spelaeicoccus albus TaxID=1280376 RepID=A0A7Z0A8W6_9MICO|nr:phosphatase PAP2 family protein [Spelaeicoccus albus]NYI65715.1 membrane-associated phospholipid phosphatase [Spelaeicoccus albus]